MKKKKATMPDLIRQSAPGPCELLAPAGSWDKMETAIRYGADAVYLGCDVFSLRTGKASFPLPSLAPAIRRAHELGAKAYVAINILARPQDLEQLERQLPRLAAAQPDAFIVSDPGILRLLRQTCPKVKIHISTQASVTNAQSCRFWYEQGACRIILARELTIKDIAAIRREVPSDLQLEVFVHGAMCVAWSGRCLLSNALTGRGANQGECAQPCRWRYRQSDANHSDQSLYLQEDEAGSYLLSSKDLCLVEYLPQLLAAGVDSIKIEGRTKSSFYVATVVKAYRQALDAALSGRDEVDAAWLAELDKTVHRPFDTGFFLTPPQADAKVSVSEDYQHVADVVGRVRAFLPRRSQAVIEQKNKIFRGDRLEVVAPQGKASTLTAAQIYDLEGEAIESTPHPGMLYALAVDAPLPLGAFLRRLGTKKQGAQPSGPVLPEQSDE